GVGPVAVPGDAERLGDGRAEVDQAVAGGQQVRGDRLLGAVAEDDRPRAALADEGAGEAVGECAGPVAGSGEGAAARGEVDGAVTAVGTQDEHAVGGVEADQVGDGRDQVDRVAYGEA